MKRNFNIIRTDCGIRLVRLFDETCLYNSTLIENLGLINTKISVSTDFTNDHEFVLRLKEHDLLYEYEIWKKGELLDETICLCSYRLKKYFKKIPSLLFVTVKD